MLVTGSYEDQWRCEGPFNGHTFNLVTIQVSNDRIDKRCACRVIWREGDGFIPKLIIYNVGVEIEDALNVRELNISQESKHRSDVIINGRVIQLNTRSYIDIHIGTFYFSYE